MQKYFLLFRCICLFSNFGRLFKLLRSFMKSIQRISTLIIDQQQLLHFECLVNYIVYYVFIDRILPSKFKLFLKLRVYL